MTWAGQGFNPSPLMPVSTLVHHLRMALDERIFYSVGYGGGNWYHQYGIEPLNPLTPTGDAINGILALLRPTGSATRQDRTWLDNTFWPEGYTTPGLDAMPMLFQLYSTDNPADGKEWCTATLDDYYARMNALAGFDIREDITSLAIPTPELFMGIRNVINSFRFGFSQAEFTYHQRRWVTDYDGQEWHDTFYEWEGMTGDFGYMGGLGLGQSIESGTVAIDGGDGWMLEGDGIRWIYKNYPTAQGVDCLAFVTHCTENSSAPEPLDRYVQGEYYVIPWDGSPLNLTEGFNPPAPPHHAVPTEQDNYLIFRYGCAVVDFSRKLLYSDLLPDVDYKPLFDWIPGNLSLFDRPRYINPDGSVSTVDTISFECDGYEILVPTIVWGTDGEPRRLSEEEAIERYFNTGEYLGMFSDLNDANGYAQALHEQQAQLYGN